MITGAARGMGREHALLMAERGADLILNDLDADVLARTAEDCRALGRTVTELACDNTDIGNFTRLIGEHEAEHGRVDILVNNAGITKDTLMLRMTEAHWDDVIQTNLKSIFNLTKHLIRPMMKKRGGSIINLSSIVGMTGNAGQANYAASKAGIIGFTKSIAKEMGSRNIRCNAIAPGFIETDMTESLDDKVKESYLQNIPMNRLGKAEEVADVCVFLGSDLSTYLSGQVISVCGALNT